MVVLFSAAVKPLTDEAKDIKGSGSSPPFVKDG